MSGSLMSFMTALCAAAAAVCLALYIVRTLSSVQLERRTEFFKPVPLLFKLLIPFLPLVRPWISGTGCAVWREMENTKLQMAGYDEAISPTDFIGLKLLFAITGLLVLVTGVLGKQLLFSLTLGVLLAFYPTLWINAVIKKRHLSIMRALPNVLDLLTLSVESGRDLLSALRDILARRRMDDLGEELTRTFQEIQIGRKRTDALRGLAQRVRQVDLSATVNAIIQAEEFGVSIAQLLRIQGDMQRNKRFALAEKLANESSVKIIIPVVVCILPAVFIILMGPLLVQTMRMFRQG